MKAYSKLRTTLEEKKSTSMKDNFQLKTTFVILETIFDTPLSCFLPFFSCATIMIQQKGEKGQKHHCPQNQNYCTFGGRLIIASLLDIKR